MIAAPKRPDPPPELAKGYDHPEVKKALVKDLGGKCYLCESVRRQLEVEHLRPKSAGGGRDDWGNLFLAGDAAHIVPPTGAKGLNLAVSDVHYLSRGLIQHYSEHDDHYLDNYSDMALRRVWASVRFSWWMTTLLHRFPDQGDIDQRLQEAELAYIRSSERAQAAMCEQYAGLPFES